jgi:hypothetical protein
MTMADDDAIRYVNREGCISEATMELSSHLVLAPTLHESALAEPLPL